MENFYTQTWFEPISIKNLKPQEKRRAKEAIIILEQNSTTKKTQRINGVQ